jgi:uncharacterized membrane protein (UPF0127 family)
MIHRASLIIAAWIAIALMPALAACDATPQVTIVDADNSARATVKVELAETPDARELGLMYRNHLDDNAGMLFIFPSAGTEQFWMKNTVIPLDMLFADSEGKLLGIVANAQPYSEALLGGFAGTQYVLEVNGGFAAAHLIAVGDRLKFSGFDPHTTH